MVDEYKSDCGEVLESIRQDESTLESIGSVLRLKRTLQVLEMTRYHIRKEVFVHKATIAPIRKVSFEVLTLILTSALLDDPIPGWPDYSTSRRCSLMTVCKLWQSVIIQCPSLWTFCAFSKGTTEEPLKSRIQTWVIRSGNLPLRATLSIKSEDDLSYLWIRCIDPIIIRLSGLKLNPLEPKLNPLEALDIDLSKWGLLSFFKKLGDAPHLTFLHLSNLEFSLDTSAKDWILNFHELRALEIRNSIICFPIKAPRVQSVHITFSSFSIYRLCQLIADASEIEELIFESVENYPSYRSPVEIPKLVNLKHVKLEPDYPRKPFNRFQSSVLQSCQNHQLTKLTLTISNKTTAYAIPIDIFPGLTSLGFIIYTNAGQGRSFILGSMIGKWLRAASDLKELEIRSERRHTLLDPILNYILTGPKTSTICENLKCLMLRGGTIFFPEIIHRIFMERTINRSAQDDRPSLSLLIHGVHLVVKGSSDGLYIDPDKETYKMDWEDAGSASFHKFSDKFDFKAGYNALEDFFEIGCGETRLRVLQSLFKSEYGFRYGEEYESLSESPSLDSEDSDVIEGDG